MLTYDEAQTMMRKARNGQRKLANNTYLRHASGQPDREGNSLGGAGDYAVRYHGTDVVIIHADGNYSLNTGGWYTYTTKDRINRFSPARVWSERGVWYLHSASDPKTAPRVQKCRKCHGKGTYETAAYRYRQWDGTGEWADAPLVTHPAETHKCYQCDGSGRHDYGSNPNPVRFFDGITVGPDGSAIGDNLTRLHDVTEQDAANATMRKAIAEYVAGYTDEEIRRLVTEAQDGGAAGDCFFCQMRVVDGPDKGKPAGDLGPKDNGRHLTDHVEEHYRMANLMLNALAARGYGSPMVILSVAGSDSGAAHSYGDMVRDSLTKYLRKRLLNGVATS